MTNTPTKNANIGSNSNVIVETFTKLAALDVRDATARAALFGTLRYANVKASDIASGGVHYKALQVAIITAWQGKAFATSYFKDTDGKRIIAGRVLEQNAITFSKVSKERNDWTKNLGSKIAKVQRSYAAFCEAPKVEDLPKDADGNPVVPAKGSKVAGRVAPLSERLLDSIAKMAAAIAREVEKKDKAKEPIGFDHVAFGKILDEAKKMLPKK